MKVPIVVSDYQTKQSSRKITPIAAIDIATLKFIVKANFSFKKQKV